MMLLLLMTCAHVAATFAGVHVSGRVGYNSQVNGFYNREGSAYFKGTSPDDSAPKWIVYRPHGKEWCISGVPDCGGRQRTAYAYAPGQPGTLPLTGWHVWDGSAMILDSRVSIASGHGPANSLLRFVSPAPGLHTMLCSDIMINISVFEVGDVRLWSIVDPADPLVEYGVIKERVLVGEWHVKKGASVSAAPTANLAFRNFGPDFIWVAELHMGGKVVSVQTTDFSCKFSDLSSQLFLHEKQLKVFDDAIVLEGAASLGMASSELALSSSETPVLAQFGVFQGAALATIAQLAGPLHVHGFDAFEGLPGTWWSRDKGSYFVSDRCLLERRLARAGHHNVHLHAGWFNETSKQLANRTIAFLHAAAGPYSSTIIFLEVLACALAPGTVIMFDELYNYPGWRDHELKAWEEVASRFKIEFAYLGFASERAVPVVITKVGDGPCRAREADANYLMRSLNAMPLAIQASYAGALLTWGTNNFLSDDWSADELLSWCISLFEWQKQKLAIDACHHEVKTRLMPQWADRASNLPLRARPTPWRHSSSWFRCSFRARRKGPINTHSLEHGTPDHKALHSQKLLTDHEQLSYLQDSDPSLSNLTARFKAAAQLLGNNTCFPDDASPLCRVAFTHVAGAINRGHRVHECQLPDRTMTASEFSALPGIRPEVFKDSLGESFAQNGYFVVDDALEKHASDCASSILFNSTIWYGWFPSMVEPSYWKTRADEGLHQESIFKLASDLQSAVPLLASLPYMWHWAYLFENAGDGIGVHADDFGINCNIYLTDTSANLADTSGGMVLYFSGVTDDMSKLDAYTWSQDLERDAVKSSLIKDGKGQVRIPYRKNRVVCFDSSLFHRTDYPLHFRPGWKNRRTSITLLFGHRAWRPVLPYQKKYRIHNGSSSHSIKEVPTGECSANESVKGDTLPACQCDVTTKFWKDSFNNNFCRLSPASQKKDCMFIGTWRPKYNTTVNANCFLVTGTADCIPSPGLRTLPSTSVVDSALENLTADMSAAALALRTALAEAGYAPRQGSATSTLVQLARGAFPGAWQVGSDHAVDIQRALPPIGTDDAADMMRLFLLNLGLPPNRVTALLPAPSVAMLRQLGILVDVGHSVFSVVQLGPVGEDQIGLIATDWIRHATTGLTSDGNITAVMYLGEDSRSLVASTSGIVRKRQPTRFLDVCTGSGVQGIMAALHASHVERLVFVDVNPRAERFVRFNLLLNSLRGEFLLGSIGDLTIAGPFDMVTGNPPYWPLPPSKDGRELLFQTGGVSGESVTELIVQKTSALLSSEGVLALVTPVFNLGQVEMRLAHWWQGPASSFHIFHSDILSADGFVKAYGGETFEKKWRDYSDDGFKSAGINNASIHGLIFAVAGKTGASYVHIPHLWFAVSGCPGPNLDFPLGEVCLQKSSSAFGRELRQLVIDELHNSTKRLL